uniref:ATP-dependent DNA helicase n=1 Tax=Cajanus cajan TaxID=3821 RepID=A0A151TPS4_CAJCA|nr:hypothetical protein KK1_022660 [Cajanus cajan]
MFSFTSIGDKLETTINDGRGPPQFVLSGQNYHIMVSLLPQNSCQPKCSQLYIHIYIYIYIFYYNNKIDEQGFDTSLVRNLTTMIDDYNCLAMRFKLVRDFVSQLGTTNYCFWLFRHRSKDPRIYNILDANEVTALIVGDFEIMNVGRDIIVKRNERGEIDPSPIGKCVLLPPSIIGGIKYLFNNCQDAMTICKRFKYLDFFITITYIVNCREIRDFVTERGLTTSNRPNIVCSVFKMKLDELMNDLKKKEIFDKFNANIDKVIFVELPNPSLYPKLAEAVSTYMIQGPCRAANYKSPCMKEGQCSKYYPKVSKKCGDQGNGGDFRQILLVVRKGNKEEVVGATINLSKLWQSCKVLKLINKSFEQVNDFMLSLTPGEEIIYLSSDTPCPLDEKTEIQGEWFTYEFLNDVKCSRIPNRKLTLKVGLPVMLLKNLDQSNGLCNGTRLQVMDLGTNVISATVITDTNIGDNILIPRMNLVPIQILDSRSNFNKDNFLFAFILQ